MTCGTCQGHRYVSGLVYEAKAWGPAARKLSGGPCLDCNEDTWREPCRSMHEAFSDDLMRFRARLRRRELFWATVKWIGFGLFVALVAVLGYAGARGGCL